MKTNQSPFNFKTFWFTSDPKANDLKYGIQSAKSSHSLSDGLSEGKFPFTVTQYLPHGIPLSVPSNESFVQFA